MTYIVQELRDTADALEDVYPSFATTCKESATHIAVLEGRMAKGIALIKYLQGDSEYKDLGVILAALEGRT